MLQSTMRNHLLQMSSELQATSAYLMKMASLSPGDKYEVQSNSMLMELRTQTGIDGNSDSNENDDSDDSKSLAF